MLSARKAQKACPQCRAQLFRLFEHGFVNAPGGGAPALARRIAPSSPSSASASASASGPRSRAPTTRIGSRPFSTTTRRKLNDGLPEGQDAKEGQDTKARGEDARPEVLKEEVPGAGVTPEVPKEDVQVQGADVPLEVPKKDVQETSGAGALPEAPDSEAQGAHVPPEVPKEDVQGASGTDALPEMPDSEDQGADVPPEVPKEDAQTAIEAGAMALAEAAAKGVKMSDTELIVRQARHQFGDTLPKDYLSEEEFKLYKRFYGLPLRETRPEDVGMPIEKALLSHTHKYVVMKNQNVLLKENEDGELEEVAYEPAELQEAEGMEDGADEGVEEVDEGAEEVDEGAEGVHEGAEVEESDQPSDLGMEHILAVANNQREYDILMRLQKDFETASLQPAPEPAAEVEEEEEGDEYDDEYDDEEEYVQKAPAVEPEQGAEVDAEVDYDPRIHPLTALGQWRTYPSTIFLPKADFVNPIGKLLRRTNMTHVGQKAEETFGGRGLPHSVATPRSGITKGQLPIPMEPGDSKMSDIGADAYMATNLPGMYASVMAILVEIRKRMGPEWLHGLLARGGGEGPRVLDVGAGGAGLAAWEQVLKTEWELLHGKEEGTKRQAHPPGKKTVVIGSDRLRYRVSRFLSNTQFLPRLPDYLHSGDLPEQMSDTELPQPRKQYDVIILAHALMPIEREFKRKAMIDNLWEMLSPEGGILIVLEKGHPRGFEAVADVRHRLISDFIEAPTSDPQPESLEPESRRVREPGMIIAPCTNHKKCPMYQEPGTAHGRRDFCHFSQRFIRPPFLQKIHGATHHSHEDVNFSFVAVQRGRTATSPTPVEPESASGADANAAAFRGYEDSPEPPNTLSLPRNIMKPIKSKGHVTLDLCTPAGNIERWVVPRSFSKVAYRDARRAKWGDLWALGAKTRTVRPIRLGKGGVSPGDGGVRARRAEEAARMKGKPRVVNLEPGPSGLFGGGQTRHAVGEPVPLGGLGPAPKERRTKGGKKLQQRKVPQRRRRKGEEEEEEE